MRFVRLPACALLIATAASACGPRSSLPTLSGPTVARQTITAAIPLADINACAGLWSYHLVNLNLRITSLTRTVDGNRVNLRNEGMTINGRFHSPAGCPTSIGATDGGPATIFIQSNYGAELGTTASGDRCVQRSRTEYRTFHTEGFAGATPIVQAVMTDQFWRQFDALAVVASIAPPPDPLPANPRCPGWSEL